MGSVSNTSLSSSVLTLSLALLIFSTTLSATFWASKLVSSIRVSCVVFLSILLSLLLTEYFFFELELLMLSRRVYIGTKKWNILLAKNFRRIFTSQRQSLDFVFSLVNVKQTRWTSHRNIQHSMILLIKLSTFEIQQFKRLGYWMPNRKWHLMWHRL